MDLPACDRPLRLAPHAVLLRRSTAELQLGVDPSLVVPTAYADVASALTLDEPADPLRAAAERDGLSARELGDLVTALDAARLLQSPPAAARTDVRVVGAGPLAARTGRELLDAGFRTVYLADLPHRDDGRRPDAPPRRGHRPAPPDRLDQLCAALGQGPDRARVRRTRHFLKPEGAVVALTLVVADGPEPDRLVTDLLREHDAPHLLLRSSGDEVTVGPLVVPGSSSCVRCGDLDRRDRDGRWPWLLDQLTRLTVPPAPTLLSWAAVTATVQALAFVDGRSPESMGHTLELRSDDHTLRRRPWPVHPDCPCRWTSSAT